MKHLFLSLLFISIIPFKVLSQDILEEEKLFNIGAGFGGRYGFVGGNISVNVFDALYLFGGLGFGPHNTPAFMFQIDDRDYPVRWAAGANYYFLDPDSKFRPKLSLYYGINHLAEHYRVAVNGDVLGKFIAFGPGLTIGAGFQWLFANNTFGLDADINYAITTDTYMDEEDRHEWFFPFDKVQSPITLSIGLRYAFDI